MNYRRNFKGRQNNYWLSVTGRKAKQLGGLVFVGHFGVGFKAKSIAPKVSLGMLFVMQIQPAIVDHSVLPSFRPI